MLLILAPRRQISCECKAGMIYRVVSRTARTIQRNHVSKMKNNNNNNNKNPIHVCIYGGGIETQKLSYRILFLSISES